MKIQTKVRILGSYVNGGNSAVYTYDVHIKSHTILAADLWKLRGFKVRRPTATLTVAGVASSGAVGAPPAFATRSISISSAGVITFGANETFYAAALTAEITEIEEHPYTAMSLVVPSIDTLTADAGFCADSTVCTITTSVAEEFQDMTWIAENDIFRIAFTASALGITESTVPAMNVVIGETDLVTREYTGLYAEVAAKSIVTIAQAVSKHYEGLAAQVVNYVQSGSSPLALDLPMSIHECLIGVGV